MEGAKPIVLITGVSGYIGSQVCLSYLRHGDFQVKGTVRSVAKPEKIEPLKKGFGELFDQLQLVEADLLDDASIDRAVEGCTYVVHVASPFTTEIPKDDNVLIKPAVEGTMSVMRAAHKHKVKRVVVTSSIYSIQFTKDKKKT